MFWKFVSRVSFIRKMFMKKRYQTTYASRWPTIVINLFIFVLLLANQPKIVLSLVYNQSNGNRTNCGLQISLKLDDLIRISNRQQFLQLKNRKHQTYCDLVLTTSIDQLIELQWSYSSFKDFQFKSNQHSSSNQSILIINKRTHQSFDTNSMHRTDRLISKTNTMVIRVQRVLIRYLDNLSINANSLKLIRLDYRRLISLEQPFCSNIYNTLIYLSNSDESTVRTIDELVQNTSDRRDESDKNSYLKHVDLALNISSLFNGECVKIQYRTFYNSRLIIKRRLDTCSSNENATRINLIRSENVELYATDAQADTAICLSLINLTYSKMDANDFQPYFDVKHLDAKQLKTKLKKRNSKAIDFYSPIKDDDDEIDNCINLDDVVDQRSIDQSNLSSSLRCFVLFENKLDFESSDQFCRKVLPFEYVDVGLANLSTSSTRNFIKRFLQSKLFHNSNQLHPEQSTYSIIYNGFKSNNRLFTGLNSFTFWILNDQANYFIDNLTNNNETIQDDNASCMQISLEEQNFNNTYLFKPANCAYSLNALCQFTYQPSSDTKLSSSISPITECGEQHQFTDSTTDLNSPGRWHRFSSEPFSRSGRQKLNCTFRFTIKQTEPTKRGQLELLFTSFHLRTSSFVNSCKYDYIDIQVRCSIKATETTQRLCGNWNEKIKLLRFIGDEITLIWISNSNSKNAVRSFDARVRRIEPSSTDKKFKINNTSKDSALCSTNGNFIFYSNWCYMINYYPQVSYRTAHQICAELDSDLLIVPKQISDYYTQVDLIRKLMLDKQNSHKMSSFSDFWINSDSQHRRTGDRYKRDEVDWLSKIDSSLIESTKPTECLVLTIDDYHYLADSWPTRNHQHFHKNQSNLNASNKNVSIFNQLIDHSLVRRVRCDQRAAFICQKSPCKTSSECSNRTIQDELNQLFNQPNELTLTSPNFPNSYKNSQHQSIYINNTDPESVYVIQFMYLDIENQKNCLYDYLSIEFYPANDRTLRICGRMDQDGHRLHSRLHSHLLLNNHPHRRHHHLSIGQANFLHNFTYISEGGESLNFQFKTDYSVKGKGYKAKLNRIHLNWCQTNLSIIQLTSTQSNLTLHTPGYPEFTLPNLDCRLIINAESSNHRVLFNLLDIKINHNNESQTRNENCLDGKNFFELQLNENKSVEICSDQVQQLDDILLTKISPKNFVSFSSQMVIDYHSYRRVFGEEFNTNFKGIKFSVSSIRWNESISLTVPLEYNQDFNQTISNRSITLYSFSKLQLINYPFSLPTGLNATIYIRGPINHNIELRSPKEHFFNHDYRSIHLTSLNCTLNAQHSNARPQLVVRDEFANLKFSPAKPEQWNLCLEENNYSNYYNQLKSTRMIKSNLHILTISLNSGWTPSPFYLRLIKDVNLINKTYALPLSYPIDSCLYRPCENDGHCIKNEQINEKNQTNHELSIKPIQQDTYRCICKRGWYGMFCSLRICDLKPCSPNGQCVMNEDYTNYTCHCYIGYSGKNCKDTVATCDQDRGNPCRGGNCFLVNGIATCKCNLWFEGRYCEKSKIRIPYRPLSVRMLDEPFWLGLIAVLVVLFFICLVYLLKKKFAERIEHFFAEEIERSKTQSAIGVDSKTGNRYSLTSNLALNLNSATGSQQCMMRSHSSIICKLNNCKQSKYRITGGHSDTECNTKCKTYQGKGFLNKPEKKDNGYFSDTEYMTNRKRIPALLLRVQKIVNSTSSGQNEKANDLQKSGSLNRSFEKPRRYSLYDFVVRRQSNNLFGFDLKQATDKLTRRKKSSKKYRNMIMTNHSKSSTENDDHNHLRIPSIETVSATNDSNLIPKLVYELDEFNNSDNLDNLSQEDQSRLNVLHTSNSMLNYQVITENSQEDEQDTSIQVAELSNLENQDLRSSFSSDEDDNQSDLRLKTDFNINFDTKFQPSFKKKFQTNDALQPSKSASPIPRGSWSRSRSEQQHYDFYSPPPTLRHASDRYFRFDTSPKASTRRKKFANYKQFSCLNLGQENRYFEYPVNFVEDRDLKIDTKNLFVNTDFPVRRLSAPSGRETTVNNQQLSQPLSNQQIASQQNLSIKTSPRTYKKRWNTVDDAYNVELPSILINDEQMNLPNVESLSSEQIYGTPDLSNYLNVSFNQSSPKSPTRLSSNDYTSNNKSARIQKSYSAGNNYNRNDDLNLDRSTDEHQIVLSRMKSAQDLKMQSLIYHQSSRSKSPRRLRPEIRRNPSWPPNMSTIPTTTLPTLPVKQQITNYSSSSSSTSSENNTFVDRDSMKRRCSPHLILSNTHRLAVQQSLPTPPSTPANYENVWSKNSNYPLSSGNKKKPRSPTNLYQQSSSSSRKSPNLYPITCTDHQQPFNPSFKKQSRCFSAENREEARDSSKLRDINNNIYQMPSTVSSTNEFKSSNKYLISQQPQLYRTRSFNTTTAPVQITTLKKQNKKLNQLSSSSPTTASSSPSLSDINSEIRWRNALRNAIESSNFFNKKQENLSIYKPSQLRPNKKIVMRSNSDEKTVTNRHHAYYYSGQAARRKSRSFERSPTDEELVLIPLQMNQQQSKNKNKLKTQSSSDTVLVEPIEQLNLNQLQQAFSSESIQKDLNRNDVQESHRNNNSDRRQQSATSLNYIEIANKAKKSVTKHEIKNLARKLDLKSPDTDD